MLIFPEIQSEADKIPEEELQGKLISISLFNEDNFALRIIQEADSPLFEKAVSGLNRIDSKDWRRQWEAYKVPINDRIIKQIYSIFTKEELLVDDQARVYLRYMEMQEELFEAKRSNRWEYIFNDVVPEIDYKFTLKPYKQQIVALDALHNSEFFALLMEMGTGKSKVIADEICWVAQERKAVGKSCVKVLIVCPKSIIPVWLGTEDGKRQGEIQKNFDPELKFWSGRLKTSVEGYEVIVQGLNKVANIDALVFVTNYETVGKMMEPLAKIKFDLMVLDESTYAKSNSAKRSKAVRELGLSCKRRVILTGSPVTNTLNDLYPQFDFLQKGILGHNTFASFRRYYGQYVEYHGHEILKKWQNIKELKEYVTKCSFIVKKERCLDLPPKTYETIYVQKTLKQEELYKDLVDNFIATLTNYEDEANTIEVSVVIAQLTKLAQICSGYLKIKMDDKSFIRPIPGENPKIEALKDLVLSLEEHKKAIIWIRFVEYDYVKVLELLDKLGYKYSSIIGATNQRDREKAEVAFNYDPTSRFFVGNPQACGMGLTLLGHPSTEKEREENDYPEEVGCDSAIFYSMDFRYDSRKQAEDRCHRIGLNRPVTYYTILTENSIEERIYEVILKKAALDHELRSVKDIKNFLLGK